MASLLTGVYPSTHGAIGHADALRSGIPLLAGELRRLGYRTAAVYANPNIGRPFGFADGFDEFIDLYPARVSGQDSRAAVIGASRPGHDLGLTWDRTSGAV